MLDAILGLKNKYTRRKAKLLKSTSPVAKPWPLGEKSSSGASFYKLEVIWILCIYVGFPIIKKEKPLRTQKYND